MSQRRAFATGTAGFFSMHLSQPLLRHGWRLPGLDGVAHFRNVALGAAGPPRHCCRR